MNSQAAITTANTTVTVAATVMLLAAENVCDTTALTIIAIINVSCLITTTKS